MAADKLLVQLDPSVYYFISQGCLTVDNMNDTEEMDSVEVRASCSFVTGIDVCNCKRVSVGLSIAIMSSQCY